MDIPVVDRGRLKRVYGGGEPGVQYNGITKVCIIIIFLIIILLIKKFKDKKSHQQLSV
jgi:hypothetical protein